MHPAVWATIGLGILSIYLVVKQARRKKPVWGYKTHWLMGLGSDAPPELKLYFRKKLVNDVYQTKFIFLNRGNETIHKDGIADKITIHFKDCKILQEPSLVTNREAIRCTTKLITKGQDNQVQLDFLYLDNNDGGIIKILHTKCEKITCSGDIMGAKIGEFAGYDERSGSFVRNREAFLGAMWLGMMGMFIWVEPVRERPPGRMVDYILALKEGPNLDGIISVVLLSLAFSMFLYGMVRYVKCRKLANWIQSDYMKTD